MITVDAKIKSDMPDNDNSHSINSHIFALIRVGFNYDKTKLIDLDERLALYKENTGYLKEEALAVGADVIYEFYQDIALEWKSVDSNDFISRLFELSLKMRRRKLSTEFNDTLFHPYITASMIRVDPNVLEEPSYIQDVTRNLQLIHQYCDRRNYTFLTTAEIVREVGEGAEFNFEHVFDVQLKGDQTLTELFAVYELDKHPISLN